MFQALLAVVLFLGPMSAGQALMESRATAEAAAAGEEVARIQGVIADAQGAQERAKALLAERRNGLTEIREGIAEGDRVVVAANFLIDAESNLKAALRGLTPPEARP